VRPVEFAEQNCVFAKNQPEYLPLPTHKTEAGEVISCWALTWKERFKILFTGRLWLSVLTFNAPLQPLRPRVDSPFLKPDSKEIKP
jgi:hypothetical protein